MGTIKDDNLLVQKSRPLFSLWKEKDKINLFEYKMLDMYLSRINSHNPDDRTVSFSMKDINEIFSSHVSKAEIHERLKKFQSLVVSYGDDKAITLFEYSKIHIDEKTFDVELMCTQTARKFFFNIESIGYFKYKFRNVISISSMYSYILFNFLEMNRFRKQPFEVSFDELKKVLGCEDNYYSTFYRFNEKILKKCYNEITEKTELKFSYETVKKGRVVQGIRFEVFPLKQLEYMYECDATEQELSPDEIGLPLDEEVAINGNFTDKKEYDVVGEFGDDAFYSDDGNNKADVDSEDEVRSKVSFFSGCFKDSFSELEVKLILKSINEEMIKEDVYGRDIAKYDYLDMMYNRLLLEEQKRNIKNRFQYFLTMIKNDKPKD